MKFACFSTDFDSLARLVSKSNHYLKEGDELHGLAFRYYFGDDIIESLRKLKLNKLLIVTNINLMNYDMEGFANALLECFKKYKYDIIFLGDKIEDREIGARLSSKIGAPFIVGCRDFRVEANKLLAEKSSYGGLLTSSLEANLPAIISFDELNFEGQFSDTQAQVEEIKAQITHSRIIVRDKTVLSMRYRELSDKNRLICIGENIHEEKELKDINELATLMKAEIVGDKTIFARNWLKEWVGYSNLKIKPEVLLELGVVGDIDHVSGIQGSKMIVA